MSAPRLDKVLKDLHWAHEALNTALQDEGGGNDEVREAAVELNLMLNKYWRALDANTKRAGRTKPRTGKKD